MRAGGVVDRAKDILRLPFAHLLARALRLSSRPVGVVLVYHRLAEEPGNPDHELLPALEAKLFAAHVRHLAACYHTVPASEIVEAVRSRRRGQKFPVAITFDDDLASHARVALPILRRRAVPATFFLCGASLWQPFEFWWETLQRAVDRYGEEPLWSLVAADGTDPGSGTIHDLARAIETMSPHRRGEIAVALADRLGDVPVDAGLRADEVKALVATGCEVGFHTLHHDALPALDDGTLERMLEEGREELASVVGQDLAVIAYPHGAADERVARAAQAAGYRLGFTCSGHAVHQGAEPLRLGRAFPCPRSVGHFALGLVRTFRTASAAR